MSRITVSKASVSSSTDMSVPGFSITELAQAARKLKGICNAFFDEFENAPARISELVETCNYLSTVLEEFGALLGDSYPQETTFKRKLDECYTFITKYSALNRQHLHEAAQEERIAGKLRNTGTYAWYDFCDRGVRVTNADVLCKANNPLQFRR